MNPTVRNEPKSTQIFHMQRQDWTIKGKISALSILRLAEITLPNPYLKRPLHPQIQIGGHRKRSSTINERGSKIARISVFGCHLSPVRRQNGNRKLLFLTIFYLRSSTVLTFSIAAYPVCPNGCVLTGLVAEIVPTGVAQGLMGNEI